MKKTIKVWSLLFAGIMIASAVFTSCKKDDKGDGEKKVTISSVTSGEVAQGGTITITGENLDLITKIELGTTVLEKAGSATSVTVIVPTNFAAGATKLTVTYPGGTKEFDIVITEPGSSSNNDGLIPTTTAAGTVTGQAKAVFPIIAVPGEDFYINGNDFGNISDLQLSIGNVAIGGYLENSYGTTAPAPVVGVNFPENAEIGKNYEITIKDGETVIGTAVVQAGYTIVGFEDPAYGWGKGIVGGYFTFQYTKATNEVRYDSNIKSWYYYFYADEIRDSQNNSGDISWALFSKDKAGNLNSKITNDGAVAIDVKIGVSTAENVGLAAYFTDPHDSDNTGRYEYAWSVGKELKGQWITVYFPIKDFQYNDGWVNISDSDVDFSTIDLKAFALKNATTSASWGHFDGVGNPLEISIKNIRFVPSVPNGGIIALPPTE